MPESSSARRTNAQRSDDTRGRILRAAVVSLIEDGYAATSLGAIQARAGVSRGALLHQYPVKSELLVHAVRYLADKREASLRRLNSREPEPISGDHVDEDSPERMEWFDELWGHFTSPLFGAVMELWVAARTDPGLRQTLLPYEQQLGRTLRNIALGHIDTPPPQFDEVFEMTLTYFRGLALTTVLIDRDHREYLLALWRQTVANLLAVHPVG